MLVVVVAGLFMLSRPAPDAPPPSVMSLQNGFPRYEPTLFERHVPVTRKWGLGLAHTRLFLWRPKAHRSASGDLELRGASSASVENRELCEYQWASALVFT